MRSTSQTPSPLGYCMIGITSMSRIHKKPEAKQNRWNHSCKGKELWSLLKEAHQSATASWLHDQLDMDLGKWALYGFVGFEVEASQFPLLNRNWGAEKFKVCDWLHDTCRRAQCILRNKFLPVDEFFHVSKCHVFPVYIYGSDITWMTYDIVHSHRINTNFPARQYLLSKGLGQQAAEVHQLHAHLHSWNWWRNWFWCQWDPCEFQLYGQKVGKTTDWQHETHPIWTTLFKVIQMIFFWPSQLHLSVWLAQVFPAKLWHLGMLTENQKSAI